MPRKEVSDEVKIARYENRIKKHNEWIAANKERHTNYVSEFYFANKERLNARKKQLRREKALALKLEKIAKIAKIEIL